MNAETQTWLNSLVMATDVAAMFGVTSMTVHLWRVNRGLPAIVIPGGRRDAVRYDRAAVIKWAAEHDVPIKPVPRPRASAKHAHPAPRPLSA